VVVGGLLTLLQRESVGLNGLVELVGGLWVDGLVVEFEALVFESGADFLVGLEVDGRALDESILILVVAFTWSRSDGILVALREVIHIVVAMFLDAVRHAEILEDGVLRVVNSLNVLSVDRVLVHTILPHLDESSRFGRFLGEPVKSAFLHGPLTLKHFELSCILHVVHFLPILVDDVLFDISFDINFL
jgi:hypothetical protein